MPVGMIAFESTHNTFYPALLAGLLGELQRRNGFDTAQVDDVVMGCVDPVGEASVALQALGYKPAEVSRLVAKVAETGDTSEAIIRKALKAALK